MPVVLPLVELGALALALLCLALALLIVEIMRSVGDLVRPIWLIGSTIANGVDALAQAIANVLGKAEHGVDAAIGASWHALASFARSWWHHLEDSALADLHLAELVARLVYAHSGLRTLVHRAEAALHGIEHGVRSLEREWHGIEAKVKRLEQDWTRGIGHDLRLGLRDLRKEVRGIDQTVTTAIPKAIDYVDGKVISLGRFIGVTPGTTFSEWAKTLVFAGLAALGLKGLACDNNPLKNQDCNSNVWGDLQSLLGLAASIAVAADFTELVHEMQAIEQAAADAFTTAVGLG